ncbi:MAG: PilZ domain-containing protein [Desulfovibrionales bacterium]
MHTTDRRQYQRIGKSFQVRLQKLEYPVNDQKSVALWCKNISAGGLLLDSEDKLFEEGDKVRTTISIPRLNKFHPGFFKVFQNDAEQNLIAVAQVVRSGKRDSGPGYEIGISFVDVYEDDWRALSRMILDMTE